MVAYKSYEIGKEAESAACHFLQAQGYRLLVTNYRCRYGEIDLIMQHDTYVVFVEVRYKKNPRYGAALESIHDYKRKRIIYAAHHFLQKQKWLYKVISRFDIITLEPSQGKMHIKWYKNAFANNINELI